MYNNSIIDMFYSDFFTINFYKMYFPTHGKAMFQSGGDFVLQETMSKIKSAEDQASQIIKNSETESRSIIDDAKAEAAKMKQQIAVADKENTLKLQELEQTQRQDEIQASLTEAGQEVKMLQEQIQGKEKEAVDLIISLLT